MSSLPQTVVAGASAPLGGDVAALAHLAFAASAPGATVFGSGLDPFAPVGGVSADALDLDLSDPLQRRFGDYELEAKLGQGGMGVVYRARQRSLDREVAIKLLAAGPWASHGFVERFRLEAQSAARMQHPNIVTIHEIGEQDGLPFFSMRLVRGRSLAETIQREGALAPRQAASLLRTVAEAVNYAHRLGVLHLDIKPGNVLLEENGEALVADFGLARRLEETLAGSDEVAGTPSYMAPEQVAGGALGVATDVYALGATLYEALTARPPFRGATARETLEQVIAGGAPVPRSFDQRIPIDLQAICMRCLHKDPAQRYPDARSLAEDLGRYLEGREVKARPLNRWQRAELVMRREPRLTALVAMVVVSLLLGLLATTAQWNRADANAASALEHLWTNRTQAAEAALAEGDGFRGLRSMVDNLVEMEASGRKDLAALERRRVGILMGSAPALLRQLQLDDGASVSSVAVSPDGQHLALAFHVTGGQRWIRQYRIADGSLEWSTLNPGRQLSPFRGIPHGVIRYSPDGRFILVGLLQQPVFAAPSHHDLLVMRSADGALLNPPENDGRASDAIWSDDASLALVRFQADRSRRFPESVRLYATADWQPIGPERTHEAVQWLFMPDNKGLLATRDGLRMELLDPASFEPRWVLDLPPGQETTAWAYTADSRWLVLGANDGTVRLVEIASGRVRALPSVPVATIRWVEFDGAGRTVAALASDGLAMVWDVRSGLPRVSPFQIGTALTQWRIQLAGDLLLAPVGNTLRSWQLPPASPFDNHAQAATARLASSRDLWVNAFHFHAGSRRLVLGGRDGLVSIWQWPSPPVLREAAAPLASGRSVFDGRRVVAVDDRQVRVFDVVSETAMPWVARHPETVRFAEFSAGQRWILTVAGRSVRILDPATGEMHGAPLLLPATPLRVKLAEAAQVAVLATARYAGDELMEELWVLDLDEARWRAERPQVPGPLFQFAFDPLGRFAVVSNSEQRPDGIRDLLLPLAADAPRCDPALPPDAEPMGGGWVSVDRGGRWMWSVHNHPGRQMRVRAVDLADCAPRAEFIRPASAGQQPHPRAIGNSLVVHRLALNAVLVFDVEGRERSVPTVATTALIQDFDLSEDGTLIAQANRDAVQLFDLQRGARLSSALSAPIPGNDGIGEVRFSADASRLLARTAQGRWLSWDLTMSTQDARQLTSLVERLEGKASPDSAPLDVAGVGGAGERVALDRSRLMREVELPAVAEPGAESPFVPLDLRSVLNVRLDGTWPTRAMMVGDLLSLGVGRHRLLGVDLRIDGGVQLSGGGPASVLHPERPATDWVPVLPVSARRVHLLMLHHIPMRIGEQPRVAGQVWLRDQEGRERALDILTQEHVLTNWLADAARGKARVGWYGVFPSAIRTGGATLSDVVGGAFLVSLDVPDELGPITALRLGVGDGPMEAPLYYAVTLERVASPLSEETSP